MTDLWRIFLSLMIAVFLVCNPSANALPMIIAQTTSSDFLNLGVDKMQQGNYHQAIENFNQAIQIKEDFAVAYSDRCLAYFHLQDYHQAIADCTQAINFAPKNIEAYLNRGLAYYRQKNFSDAIADDNQAIALQPADFRAYYNRGLALSGAGYDLAAIDDFNRTLTLISPALNVTVTDIYNDRGLAYLKLQNLEKAMLDFNQAIHLNSQDYRAYFNRGCAYGRNGDDLGAVRDFSEAIRLNPSNALAYVNRGLARYRLGYYQRAIADLKTASEYFGHQGQHVAYQKTLDLLKNVQHQLKFVNVIALL
ncbi:tetratricopeptide repeat protein [Nostoc sp. CENA67]|uniref:Tetratricopeptide repeat protein n=1 Tax=Amazonocrinis nigriterrae CENA67 TaxID=2794033 RepID=A0A8J7LEM8_9NOST|nr:tetratricopeptide repeat protein [Amazonocrinis nigriterrae]MBH8566901.1 tetratricopeptide repeat protein [Amazonocrinis nigriterrae CENA67]